MSLRKTTQRTISTEEAREAIQSGRYDLAGVFQLDEREVSQLLEQFETLEYIPLADFLRLLTDAERRLLERMLQLESDYATGIRSAVAKAVLLGLLRIPPIQRDVSDPPSDKQKTDEEMEMLRKSVRAAAKVANEVQRIAKKEGAAPSLEAVDRLIEQEAKDKKADKEQVRAHLTAAREGDPPVTLGDNKQLPVVAPMPKSLHSESRHKITATVNGLIEPPRKEALTVRVPVKLTVTVIGMVTGTAVPTALEGLIGEPVMASFVADKKGQLRRTLLSAQLTETPLVMTVEVDRGFGPGHSRNNHLTICKLHSNAELVSAVVEVSTQLQLDLGL